MMPLAVAGPDRAMRSPKIAALAAGPEAASIAAKATATSPSVGDTAGSGAWPARARTSSTARPRSENRS
jgi:hypothetical protein